MSVLQPIDTWRTVDLLAQGVAVEPPRSVETIEDAAVAVVSRTGEARGRGLDFLKKANEAERIPWGNASIFLVFYYHTLFVTRDIAAAKEFEVLLRNTDRLAPLTRSDSQILQILSEAQVIAESGLSRRDFRNRAAKSVPWHLDQDSEPLVKLVEGLVESNLGLPVSLEESMTEVRKETVRMSVDPDVAMHYLVPTYSSSQPIENYFLSQATAIMGVYTKERFLVQLRNQISKQLESKHTAIVLNKAYQIALSTVFGVLTIVVAVGHAIATTPLTNSPWAFVWVGVSAIVTIFSLPISRVPKVVLSAIAFVATLPEREYLYFVNKDIDKAELDEPES